ncbi:MAG: hypothetical protein HYT15_03135 [Candidatus Magasanikbacteria bacterium]|nr:hypothetical protein [Candidatus Magasanikbacteria bacterium]
MSLKKIFLLVAVIGVVLPVFVFADEFGLQDAAPPGLIGSGSNVNSSQALPELIGTIVGTVLSFVGAIFFLLILYAGLLWMIAFGNSERVDRAKSIVEHAAIGLIIVLAAYAISRFVFGALTSTDNNAPAPTAATVNCPFITEAVECNNQYDNETSVPLCRWVGTVQNGNCERNI